VTRCFLEVASQEAHFPLNVPSHQPQNSFLMKASAIETSIPVPARTVLRGIGQIIFQGNALTGILFLLGVALSSPLMAVGLLVGAIIGFATAWLLKFNAEDLQSGIWGFNPALVGIATLFFFQPGLVSLALLVVGCVLATVFTWAVRTYVPFPTYTIPFIVTTWAILFLGQTMGATRPEGNGSALVPNVAVSPGVEATFHGVGQIMFQASLWTGLLFLVGVVLSDRIHGAWLLLGSFLGMMLASYHVQAGLRMLDPEQLIERSQFDNIQLGLYGYNAALAGLAAFLWRKGFLSTLLAIMLSVPVTEWFPSLGLPALTAPFVLVVWFLMIVDWIEGKIVAPD